MRPAVRSRPRPPTCRSTTNQDAPSPVDAPPPPPPPRLSAGDVASASATTAAALAAVAVGVRVWAPPVAGLLPGADHEAAAALLTSSPLAAAHAPAALATAAAVTLARAATLAASPAYRAERDASLTPLLGGEGAALGFGAAALWLCIVPAAAEEALFRGALLPLLSPDARGVAGVACLFGALHAAGGGRGAASVAFAAGAGAAYGALYLATGGDVAAPALAHAVANAAAAGLWWGRSRGGVED